MVWLKKMTGKNGYKIKDFMWYFKIIIQNLYLKNDLGWINKIPKAERTALGIFL